MPLHCVSANIDADNAANDADDQEPVKEPNWQVPDSNDFLHANRIKHNPLN
jgi:hypothetical protein